jgi:hypothetical protein
MGPTPKMQQQQLPLLLSNSKVKSLGATAIDVSITISNT